MATERVTFRGRAYRPAMPPSEQDDVLTVTRKLKNMTPVAAATVEITEDELRNFSRVYPRLYQVAPKNRNRLAEWGNRHEREVFEWDLDGFFTAKEDEEEGFVLRKPGCPEGVAEKVKRQREAKAADRQSDEQQPQQQKQKLSARRSGKARVAADPEAKQEDLSAQAAASAASDNQDARGAKKSNKNPVAELELLLGGMKKVASRLEDLSEGADHDDPYKEELASLAQLVSNFLGDTNQVKQDIVEQLKRRAQVGDGNGKKRALEVEDGEEEEENEKQKHQRHKAARLRAIAGLPKEDDASVQDNEMPPPAPPMETDTPMAQDGDDNSTAGTSITASPPASLIMSISRLSVEPEARVEEPKTRAEKPKARAEKPKARAKKPKARAKKPKARAEKPKTRAEKPMTRAEKTKARVEEPKTLEEDPKAETQPADDDTEEEDNHGVI